MDAQNPIEVVIGFFAKLHDGLAWVFATPARAALILTLARTSAAA